MRWQIRSTYRSGRERETTGTVRGGGGSRVRGGRGLASMVAAAELGFRGESSKGEGLKEKGDRA